jgi:ATP-dependent RNA helicase SUPV3L1/SUV3
VAKGATRGGPNPVPCLKPETGPTERKPSEGDRRDGPRRKPRRFDGIRTERPDGPRRPPPDRAHTNRPQHDRPRAERPRDKPIDPNSPFAALLELKARLEAEQKDKG